jgi:predicted amidohydrolase YtcJ
MNVMNRVARGVVLLAGFLCGANTVLAQTVQPDIILVNGKIITVDDKFTIAQAVAVKGDRIVAVGSSQDIARLAGPNTRRIDLRGRSVTPGFIDQHAHYMREGSTWTEEVRFDGVESRKQAVEMVRAKARTVAPSAWVYNLMGWTLDQFADDKKPFTREELDQIAPNHPVFLQEAYYRVYVNSRGLEAVGIRDGAPDPEWMPKGQIVRDASGRATGVILDNGVRPIEARLLELPRTRDSIEASHLAMHRDLNRAGLTTIAPTGCANGGGVRSASPWLTDTYERWAGQGQLNVRVFCQVSIPTGTNDAALDKSLPELAKIKLFQGTDYLNTFSYGENLGIANDNMLDVTAATTPDQFRLWGRIARELAKNGLPLQVHATLEGSIDGFLDQIEKIDKEYPIRTLRWAFYHSDQITKAHLERMKKLGMYVGVHMRPTVMGGIFNRIRGERSLDNPPLRWIQDSGIMWGVGTDFNLDQFKPFTTLSYMVTGRMVGGTVVNRQPIGREDALIAHTRKNAFFLFQENNLGSIQPGKLADLVVIDRDYLTVPADQIKDIKPVMTMVGGRIVYDGAAESATR